MFIEPAATEMVYQIPDEESRYEGSLALLKEHFSFSYSVLAECHVVPDAALEQIEEIYRCYSGIPECYNNAVWGVPHKKHEEDCVEEQLEFFKSKNRPFLWFLDKDSNPRLEKALLAHDFQDGGVFQGVIGSLENREFSCEVPEGITLELVEDEASLDAFYEVLSYTFCMQAESKKLYKEALWKLTDPDNRKMYHWLARKNGEAVATLSTLIENDIVSIWNGAALPEVRLQGVSTALLYFALKDALSKGCHTGASYIMTPGLAHAVCQKLGFETKWRFQVYISPDL